MQYFEFSPELREEIKNSDWIIRSSSSGEYDKLFERAFIETLQKMELDYNFSEQENEIMIINEEGGVIGAILVEIVCRNFFIRDSYQLQQIFRKIFEEMKLFYNEIKRDGQKFTYYDKAEFVLKDGKILLKKIV